MTTALDKSSSFTKGFTGSVRSTALSSSGGRRSEVSGIFNSGGNFSSLFGANEANSDYEKFTGWSYVAINAIAKRAARQNPRMARSEASVDKSTTFVKSYNSKIAGGSRVLKSHERFQIFRNRHTPPHIKGHSDNQSIVMIDQHSLLDSIMHPNDIMTKWSLFYVTVASLELTGRAYWWFYRSEKQDIYIWPIPSSWVSPISDAGGVHRAYKVMPPNSARAFEIDASEIAPFRLPDPANPTQSISPLRTQMQSVELDGLIQTAQTVSMKQGIFPGVILKTGRLPDMPGGIHGQRPVLTPDQRRDIATAIRGAYQGVRNFNEPFIIDGLIEGVEPFTNKPIEMAFQDSGKDVKSRIFGAFGLNPIVIGEIAGANRAQASVAEDNFVSNVVNPLLEMIGEVITFWIGRNEIFSDIGSDRNVFMWIDPAEAHDADVRIAEWRLALRFGCVRRNEYRANILGLPPEEEFESVPQVGVARGGDGEGGADEGGDGSQEDNNSLPGSEVIDGGERGD